MGLVRSDIPEQSPKKLKLIVNKMIQKKVLVLFTAN